MANYSLEPPQIPFTIRWGKTSIMFPPINEKLPYIPWLTQAANGYPNKELVVAKYHQLTPDFFSVLITMLKQIQTYALNETTINVSHLCLDNHYVPTIDEAENKADLAASLAIAHTFKCNPTQPNNLATELTTVLNLTPKLTRLTLSGFTLDNANAQDLSDALSKLSLLINLEIINNTLDLGVLESLINATRNLKNTLKYLSIRNNRLTLELEVDHAINYEKIFAYLEELCLLEVLDISNNALSMHDIIPALLPVLDKIVVLDIAWNTSMTLSALALLLNQACKIQELTIDFNSLTSMDVSLGLPEFSNSTLHTLNIRGELRTDAASLDRVNTVLTWLLQNTYTEKIYTEKTYDRYYNPTIMPLLMCNQAILNNKRSMLGLVMACRRKQPSLFLPVDIWNLAYNQLLDFDTKAKENIVSASNTI